jgi:hypothetical protein
MLRFRERSRRQQRLVLWALLLKAHLRLWARARRRSARQLVAVAVPSVVAGAMLEYFLDPRSGRRRRALVRDRTRGAVRRRRRLIRRQAHYEAGKVAGLRHALSHRDHGAADLDDVSLVRKVESELFRDRTLPKGAISINADRGIVVLRGQIDDAEQIRQIERAVRKIAGVREVENLLHASSVPAPASRPHGDPRIGPNHTEECGARRSPARAAQIGGARGKRAAKPSRGASSPRPRARPPSRSRPRQQA